MGLSSREILKELGVGKSYASLGDDLGPGSDREQKTTAPAAGWKQAILDAIQQLENAQKMRTAPCTHRSMNNLIFLTAGGRLEWCGICGSIDTWGNRSFPTRAIDFEGELQP